MFSSLRVRVLFLATFASLALASNAQAQLTWDSSGANPTAPVDGSGNWNTTSPLWSNGTADSIWTNDGSATAVFGFAAGTGTAGTVTVTTPINVAGIVFNAPHAGSYTIADNGGGNTITLSGTTPAISVNGAATNATINNVLTGSAGLLFNGGGTLTFGAVNTYTGNTTLNGGSLVLSAGADNTSLSGRLVFGAVSGSTNASTLDATNSNLTLTGLTDQTFYNSAATTQANNIKIGVGKTLTINGPTALGVSNTATANTIFTSDIFSGGGKFVANATGATAFVVAPNNSQANFGNNVTVDMSGLNGVAINIDSAGEFRLAGGLGSTGNRSVAAMTLATTVANTIAPQSAITAGTVTIGGGSNSNGGTGNLLHLGATNDAAHPAANIINANLIRIGLDKASTNVDFLSTGSFGTLKIRGFGGTDSDRANITIGSRGQSGTANPASNVTLTGSGRSVDILAGTITIGESTNSSTGSGSFSFETGIVDANAINLAHRTNGTAIGTFTLGSNSSSTGILNVNGAFSLANASPAAATATGTLNINGGTANIFGGISQTGTNTANAIVNLNGGILDMHGSSIGGGSAAVTFNATAGTLQNVSEINGGNSGLTKNGAGTLTLAGMSTYTGTTTIAGGAVQLAGANVAPNSTFVVNSNNGLTFAPAVGIFSIGSLSGSSNFALTDTAAQPVTLSLGGNGSTQTYSGGMGGAGGVTVTGGTLTLGGNNTYTGNTTINGGTLVMNSTGSLASAGAVKVNSGGTLAGAMGAAKSIGATTLSTGGTIIAGTGTTTPGTLNVSNLIVNGGTLQFNLGTTTTSSLLNVLSGGSAVFNNPGLPGNSVPTISIPMSAAALGSYTLVQSTTPISYPGGVPNFITSFPSDAFTYHLNFTNPNSILLDVTGQIAHLLWTGGTGAGDQTTWDNTTNASSQNWKNTDTNINGVNYADPSIVTFGDLASTNVFISLNSNVTPSSVTVGGATTSYTIQGGGSIGGAVASLAKNGNTTLVLLTANTYGGGTTINGGLVQINSATSLGASTGTATINSATLEVLGGNTISGTRNFLLGSPNSTIQVDNGASYSTSGTINDVSAGTPGTLNATGGGTLGLLGSNGYTGGTVISGGTIVQINSATSLGAATGGVKINAGTLEALGSVTSTRNFQIGDFTSTIQVDGAANTFTIGGTISNGAATGTLNKTGAGILVLSGNNSYSGGTVVGSSLLAGGTLSISSDSPGLLNLGPVNAIVPGSQFNNNIVLTNGGVLGTTTTMALNSGRSIGLSGNGSLSAAIGTTLTYGGAITDDNTVGNLSVVGGGTLYITGNSNYTGTTTITGATLQIAAGTNRLPTGNTWNTATTGILVLGDANGPANQAVTTLSSGGASAIPSIVGGNAAVSILTINYNGASANYSRGIGGPGANQNNVALVFGGSGVLRLNAAGGTNADNTYTGGTTINAGTLTAAQTHAFGATSSLVTINGGTMAIEAGTSTATGISPYNIAIPDAASATINSGRNSNGAAFTQTLGSLNIGAATLNVGAGNFINAGTASLAFSGASTLTSTATGTTVLNPTNAALTLGTVSGSATAGNTTTLQLDGSSTGNAVGAISNGGGGGKVALLKSGSSTWTLSGANTYTGNTTITGGTLLVNGHPTGGGAFSVTGGGTLGGTGNITAPVTVDSSSIVNPGVTTGTLTASSVSLSGTLNIDVNEAEANVNDVLNVTGALALSNATLNVNLTGVQGHAIYVFSHYGSLTADPTFGTVNMGGLPTGYAVDYNYLSAHELALVSYFHGDFNRDGQVNTSDVSAMLSALTDLSSYQSQNNLSGSQLLAIADFDGDHAVTNRDIQPMLDFAATLPGAGSVTAVPEPGSALMMAIGVVAATAWRRRRRSGLIA